MDNEYDCLKYKALIPREENLWRNSKGLPHTYGCPRSIYKTWWILKDIKGFQQDGLRLSKQFLEERQNITGP